MLKNGSYPVLRSKPTPPTPLVQSESSNSDSPRHESSIGLGGTSTRLAASSGTNVCTSLGPPPVPATRGSLPSVVYQMSPALAVIVRTAPLSTCPPCWNRSSM